MNASDIVDKKASKGTKLYIREILKELKNNKTLKNCDIGALKMLASAYDKYYDCMQKLEDEGMVIIGRRGQTFPNPASQLASKFYAQVLAYQDAFGLTPKSRSKLNVVEEEESPMAMFIKMKQEKLTKNK